MKNLIRPFVSILFLFVGVFLYAQDSLLIKGRVISAFTKEAPYKITYIKEKGTTNGAIADSLGYFEFKPISLKQDYILEISSGIIPSFDYTYKKEWMSRKYPKSIIIKEHCELGNPYEDMKKGNLKLYLQGGIAPVENTRADNRFERRYRIQ
ncbi:hypothetical protein POV27_18640 [Aureisphaera galaxeae]|uniref:FEKKY domain-containing protein n=1 Tax=Aureisphaera galaxeae TaxID=1538023 RepID=UPI002350EF59|nr:hypothetical protein [Aureisphaera galaxeae]MDC8006077.1 hypothetical protein [Aureisphaera galaxeae]